MWSLLKNAILSTKKIDDGGKKSRSPETGASFLSGSTQNGEFLKFSSINRSGHDDKASEDEVYIDPEKGTAWVIDGASSFGDIHVARLYESDSQWYAKRLSELFAERETPTNPSFMFEDVIGQISEEYEALLDKDLNMLDRGHLPSASAIWCRWEKEMSRLTFSGLGDCVGLALTEDGQIKRSGDIDAHIVEMSNLKNWLQNESDAQVLQHILDYRSKMNMPEGFWTFSVHPIAANYAAVERFRFKAGEKIKVLLLSDGLYRLVTTYGRFSERQLIEFVSSYGLESVVNELRTFETDESENAKYGRLKKSDDASACYFEIEN